MFIYNINQLLKLSILRKLKKFLNMWHFSHVQLFATLWTVACSSIHGIFSGKNTGVGCHASLQGILTT